MESVKERQSLAEIIIGMKRRRNTVSSILYILGFLKTLSGHCFSCRMLGLQLRIPSSPSLHHNHSWAFNANATFLLYSSSTRHIFSSPLSPPSFLRQFHSADDLDVRSISSRPSIPGPRVPGWVKENENSAPLPNNSKYYKVSITGEPDPECREMKNVAEFTRRVSQLHMHTESPICEESPPPFT